MDQQLLLILLFFIICNVVGIIVFLFRALYLKKLFLHGSKNDRKYLEQGIRYLEQILAVFLAYVEKSKFDAKETAFLDLKKKKEATDAESEEIKEKVADLKEKITDLDNLTAELKASFIESSKEMDMLRTQEKELRSKTEAMKQELDQVMSKIEQLMIDFSSSQEIVQTLNKVKADILSSQEKIYWYQEKITEINMNYMQLKRVYDALDIEYNQLYEKRNQEEEEFEAKELEKLDQEQEHQEYDHLKT